MSRGGKRPPHHHVAGSSFAPSALPHDDDAASPVGSNPWGASPRRREGGQFAPPHKGAAASPAGLSNLWEASPRHHGQFAKTSPDRRLRGGVAAPAAAGEAAAAASSPPPSACPACPACPACHSVPVRGGARRASRKRHRTPPALVQWASGAPCIHAPASRRSGSCSLNPGNRHPLRCHPRRGRRGCLPSAATKPRPCTQRQQGGLPPRLRAPSPCG
mmetsp:Transcript_25647/g.50062  ORF Transcript_25647/g.50062 Transcript_25647/m.50062 type:complete len:217 (+) Transcript_25647:54-704(+)